MPTNLSPESLERLAKLMGWEPLHETYPDDYCDGEAWATPGGSVFTCIRWDLIVTDATCELIRAVVATLPDEVQLKYYCELAGIKPLIAHDEDGDPWDGWVFDPEDIGRIDQATVHERLVALDKAKEGK